MDTLDTTETLMAASAMGVVAAFCLWLIFYFTTLRGNEKNLRVVRTVTLFVILCIGFVTGLMAGSYTAIKRLKNEFIANATISLPESMRTRTFSVANLEDTLPEFMREMNARISIPDNSASKTIEESITERFLAERAPAIDYFKTYERDGVVDINDIFAFIDADANERIRAPFLMLSAIVAVAMALYFTLGTMAAQRIRRKALTALE